MKSRLELLESLLLFNQPLKTILEELSKYGWDSDKPLIIVTPYHLSNLFKRYLNGELSIHDLETWANSVECRDDIGRQDNTSLFVSEIIYTLANPLLAGKVDEFKIRQWLDVLGRDMEIGN
jgi:hypothetical protein